MQEVSRSVHGCTHEANVILTTSGHELLFIITSVDGFRGCMMNTLIWLWIHKHDSCYSWQALSRFLINACTNIYYGKEGLCDLRTYQHNKIIYMTKNQYTRDCVGVPGWPNVTACSRTKGCATPYLTELPFASLVCCCALVMVVKWWDLFTKYLKNGAVGLEVLGPDLTMWWDLFTK